jgi:hypothetical protein
MCDLTPGACRPVPPHSAVALRVFPAKRASEPVRGKRAGLMCGLAIGTGQAAWVRPALYDFNIQLSSNQKATARAQRKRNREMQGLCVACERTQHVALEVESAGT